MAEKSVKISNNWVKEILTKLNEFFKTQPDQCEFTALFNSFTYVQAGAATKNLAAFAEVAKKGTNADD